MFNSKLLNYIKLPEGKLNNLQPNDGTIVSMDWFKGKFTGKPHIYIYLLGKSMVSCRFSLKPIH